MKLFTLIRELMTPSGVSGPAGAAYLRGVVGIGHALLGAAIAVALPNWFGSIEPLVVLLLYWIIKEAGDLRRGGNKLDGIEDAAFVGFGAIYGPAWWPFAVLCLSLVAMVRGARNA
ncbi:MAG: hypothetical protein U5N55_01500 [Cypionkella sp.]|nr:hypothetical protein [Cypionkella sp.]